MAKGSFTPPSVDTNNIQQLPDIVTDQAVPLKELFDKVGADIIAYVTNTLIAELNGDGGSNKIGHDSPNLASDNVEDALEELQANIQSAVIGGIPDGTITDIKLSDAAGQIKDRVSMAEGDISALQTDVSYIESDLNYLTATISSRQIRVPKVGNLPVTRFRISSSIATGSQITISFDSGATSLPLVDTDLGAITKIESGIHELVFDTTRYILNPFGQVKEKVSKTGDIMTGDLTVPTINGKTPAYAVTPTETVITTGFASGWSGSVSIRKNQEGQKKVRYDLTKTSDIAFGDIPFTLDSQYRPLTTEDILAFSFAADGNVINGALTAGFINTDGNLVLIPTGSVTANVRRIRFSATFY